MVDIAGFEIFVGLSSVTLRSTHYELLQDDIQDIEKKVDIRDNRQRPLSNSQQTRFHAAGRLPGTKKTFD